MVLQTGNVIRKHPAGQRFPPLSAPAHPETRTGPFHGARRTVGRNGLAHILSEADQQFVVTDPETSRDEIHQLKFRLRRVGCFHQSQPVGDPVHVRVYADSRYAVTERDNQRGCFTPHTLEREQFVHAVGYPAAVFRDQAAGDVPDGFRLGFVETGRKYGLTDRVQAEAGNTRGGVGPAEQPDGRRVRDLILRSQADHRRNEYPEGITFFPGNF